MLDVILKVMKMFYVLEPELLIVVVWLKDIHLNPIEGLTKRNGFSPFSQIFQESVFKASFFNKTLKMYRKIVIYTA